MALTSATVKMALATILIGSLAACSGGGGSSPGGGTTPGGNVNPKDAVKSETIGVFTSIKAGALGAGGVKPKDFELPAVPDCPAGASPARKPSQTFDSDLAVGKKFSEIYTNATTES
ncbi:MAG: hypothetical protein AAB250_12010, partial [Bdellovibrionota bacterium]